MPIPRIGDRVMLTENDDENDVMNGDVGILVDAYERDVGSNRRRFLAVDFDCGKRVEFPLAKWRSLILAYAGTVHKNQRSEEHTSELQSLMRNSYAVFCLQKKIFHNLAEHPI